VYSIVLGSVQTQASFSEIETSSPAVSQERPSAKLAGTRTHSPLSTTRR
jgi:hypothetical protein